MASKRFRSERTVSTYCYQCVAGPDLLKVRIQDGIATEVTPNFDAATIHPAGGKACVKAFGLVQKAYNPNRILYPMKRTNPKKGRNEDPRFVRVSWEEALSLVAHRLNVVRKAGLTDENGYPRVDASFGGGGTPTAYMGTLPAFLSAWGPIDMSFGSGQGVKCYHSEHLYGELWHRGFTVSPNTPLCEYLVPFGANVEASGGVCGVRRHADARKRGMKRVQIEPHLSVTGACSAEWIPIRPKTDSAFLFAMIHVLLHEHPRDRLDLSFLKDRTSSPYLIGPGGFFLRDAKNRKPLVMDSASGRAVPFDTTAIEPVLEGTFVASGVEAGEVADGLTARRLVRLPYQSGDFVLGHRSRQQRDGEISVHRLLHVHRASVFYRRRCCQAGNSGTGAFLVLLIGRRSERIRYTSLTFVPLAILHLSVAMRIAGDVGELSTLRRLSGLAAMLAIAACATSLLLTPAKATVPLREDHG
jgi:anaerobic selenocysteine-containing dehydrogenase